MPHIGGLLSPILRSQSSTVKRLNAAVCKARNSFKVLPLDKVGTRRGEQFRYWSMNEFRKCIVTPLSKHGITWECVFVPCPETKKTVIVGVLSFEDEWKESALIVREGYDMMDDGSWKTKYEKVLGDKMLQPEAEDSTEAEAEELEHVVAMQKSEWDNNYKTAEAAIKNARTPQDAQRLMDRVAEHLTAKTMAPDSDSKLQRIVTDKFTKEG